MYKFNGTPLLTSVLLAKLSHTTNNGGHAIVVQLRSFLFNIYLFALCKEQSTIAWSCLHNSQIYRYKVPVVFVGPRCMLLLAVAAQ